MALVELDQPIVNFVRAVDPTFDALDGSCLVDRSAVRSVQGARIHTCTAAVLIKRIGCAVTVDVEVATKPFNTGDTSYRR